MASQLLKVPRPEELPKTAAGVATPKITSEEFACAIIAGCPYSTSIKAFVGLITSLGPKERNVDWHRVCQILRGCNEPVSRKWRRWAHKLLIKNLVEIEHVIWRRILAICNKEIAAAAAVNPNYELRKEDLVGPATAILSMEKQALENVHCYACSECSGLDYVVDELVEQTGCCTL